MGWTEIPGGMVTSLPLAAAIDVDGDLFVFAVGPEQGVYCNRRTGDTWDASWTRIAGGQTKNAVAAVVNSMGGVTVVITGLDGRLYQSWRDRHEGTWSEWASLDGGAGSTTMAVAGAGDDAKIAWFLAGNNKRVYADVQKYLIAY